MAREPSVLERHYERLSLLQLRRIGIDSEIEATKQRIEEIEGAARARLAPDVAEGEPVTGERASEWVERLKCGSQSTNPTERSTNHVHPV